MMSEAKPVRWGRAERRASARLPASGVDPVNGDCAVYAKFGAVRERAWLATDGGRPYRSQRSALPPVRCVGRKCWNGMSDG